jgi:hypothetical protein
MIRAYNAKQWEVRAILDGRKSCTRRLVNPRQFIGMLPDKCKKAVPDEFLKGKRMMFKPYCDMTDAELIMTAYKAPYQPGDILYVRETWYKGLERYIYRADYSDTEKFYRDGKEIEMKWHPSIHMPKEAARIWLRVTDVRVERLRDITLEQIGREGVEVEYPHVLNGEEKRYAFSALWNSTIKKSDIDRYGWDANPYVWVIEFERCEKPEIN